MNSVFDRLTPEEKAEQEVIELLSEGPADLVDLDLQGRTGSGETLKAVNRLRRQGRVQMEKLGNGRFQFRLDDRRAQVRPEALVGVLFFVLVLVGGIAIVNGWFL